MPRVAKKVPKAIPLFAAYAKKHEKHRHTKEAIDLFLTLCQERWEAFAESHNRNVQVKEKTPADPIKTLEKAMNKVSQQVEAVQDDAHALSQVKEKIQEVTPPVLRHVLMNEVSATQNHHASTDHLVNKVVPAIQYLDKILEFCMKKSQDQTVLKALQEGKTCIQKVRHNLEDNPAENDNDNDNDAESEMEAEHDDEDDDVEVEAKHENRNDHEHQGSFN